MSFNPFEEKPKKIEKTIEGWNKIFVKPYDKNTVDPFTKVRIILMNGTEFEMNWHSHQFARHCLNNDLRREIALIRRVEQQQQKKISSLKPIDEDILETTISYEQLAIELTANLAQRESDMRVKKALDFALLEDFDHLYRFSNLLMMEQGIDAKNLVGGFTEITPGRPTISEHRHPYDDVRFAGDNKVADPITRLNVAIITAAEQQTMNFYMNVANLYKSEMGRKLFSEIGMIEEQHVSQYESLMDPTCTWLVSLLEHEYTECYLYYSMINDETDEQIKRIWEVCLEQEIVHLHKANELLKKYENRDFTSVYRNGGNFPELLSFGNSNIDYIRKVLKNTVFNTAKKEDYVKVSSLPQDYEFFKIQNIINKNVAQVPSHKVIDMYLKNNKQDYRFETTLNPVKELQKRDQDNTTVGR